MNENREKNNINYYLNHLLKKDDKSVYGLKFETKLSLHDCINVVLNNKNNFIIKNFNKINPIKYLIFFHNQKTGENILMDYEIKADEYNFLSLHIIEK